MKYINAAEILPKQLLKELQTYIEGSVLYVPKVSTKKEWGAMSGARTFYQERNKDIQKRFHEDYSIDVLSEQYGLAYSSRRGNTIDTFWWTGCLDECCKTGRILSKIRRLGYAV